MKNSPGQLAIKAVGTLVLAVGFIILLARTPFMPNHTNALGTQVQDALQLRATELNTGAAEQAELAASSLAIAGLDPSLGLLSAQFDASDSEAGFATREYQLDGECMGAGRRHIQQVCPDCDVISGGQRGEQPEMLMWKQPETAGEHLLAVSADCTNVASDGQAVVSVLAFGDGNIHLSAGQSAADGIVPLLPGSKRLATFELGQWLATVDSTPRPDSALNDMAGALSRQGWREVSGQSVADLQVFDIQRVFVNRANELCIVSISADDGTPQLLTIVNHSTRG